MSFQCKDIPICTPFKRLYIGSLGASAAAKQFGITTIVSVCESIRDNDLKNKDPSIRYVSIRVADNDPNLRKSILPPLFKNENEKILIQCKDGHNRSAAIICLIAIHQFRLPLRSFLAVLRRFHPGANPSPLFMSQLKVVAANLDFTTPIPWMPDIPNKHKYKCIVEYARALLRCAKAKGPLTHMRMRIYVRENDPVSKAQVDTYRFKTPQSADKTCSRIARKLSPCIALPKRRMCGVSKSNEKTIAAV